jgi:hypothetical protein
MLLLACPPGPTTSSHNVILASVPFSFRNSGRQSRSLYHRCSMQHNNFCSATLPVLSLQHIVAASVSPSFLRVMCNIQKKHHFLKYLLTIFSVRDSLYGTYLLSERADAAHSATFFLCQFSLLQMVLCSNELTKILLRIGTCVYGVQFVNLFPHQFNFVHVRQSCSRECIAGFTRKIGDCSF